MTRGLRSCHRLSRLGCIAIALVVATTGHNAELQNPDVDRHPIETHADLEVTRFGADSHGHDSHSHGSDSQGAAGSSQYRPSDFGADWKTLYEKFNDADLAPAEVAEQVLTAAVSPSVVQGELRVLVINIATPTRTATPRDPLAASYAQAANLMNVMSRGLASVRVDIFPRDVVVPDVASFCNDFMRLSDSAFAVVNAEIPTDGYRSIDFILPLRVGESCGWAGMANLPGRTSWNMATEQWSPHPTTILHEWGHQYSLAHLKAIRCTKDGVDVHLVDRVGRGAGQCAVAEYGGAFSVMGGAMSSVAGAQIFTAGERAQLGWLRPGEQRATYEGTFTLGIDGPLSLLWLQNSEGDIFQVEYVQRFAATNDRWFFDPFSRKSHWINNASDFLQPGVMVKYISTYREHPFAPSGYLIEGFVIDATTETIFSVDSAFRAGHSFVDPTGSLSVEVLSVDATSAQVKVRGVPFKPNRAEKVSAQVTDVRGVFDLAFTPVVADPPVTQYEVQVANNYAMRDSITVTVPGPGRVTIPNFKDTFMVYRIAPVNAAGRGEYNSGLNRLQWPPSAKTQEAAGVKQPKGGAQTLQCKKGRRTREFVAESCPAGWAKV